VTATRDAEGVLARLVADAAAPASRKLAGNYRRRYRSVIKVSDGAGVFTEATSDVVALKRNCLANDVSPFPTF